MSTAARPQNKKNGEVFPHFKPENPECFKLWILSEMRQRRDLVPALGNLSL